MFGFWRTLDTGERNVKSNASGVYSFTGLDASTYRVRRVLPTGYVHSTPTGSLNVTLTAGQNVSNINIGVKPA